MFGTAPYSARTRIEVKRASYDAPLVLTGQIQRGSSGVWRAVPVPDPAFFAASALAQAPSEAPAQPMPVVQQSALDKENSVNLSPLGILSGSYGLNYERLIGGYHGVLIEGNFSSSSGVVESGICTAKCES